VESHPEVLARHCTEAGLLEKAARLWSKAGQRSLDLVALAAEAVAYLQEGLAIIERLPPSDDRYSLEIALREPLHSARSAGPMSRRLGVAGGVVNATAILQLTQQQSRARVSWSGEGMRSNTITRSDSRPHARHACLG
jgi:hypothetical protein